jgi:hypothetical protein
MKGFAGHFMVFSFLTFCASAATRYVDLNNPTPATPYASWPTAAQNIQDAIDAASPGDIVLVASGVYQTGGRVVYGSLTNRIVVDKAVTVMSISGPMTTVIQGNSAVDDSAVRCVYLTNNASLAGFMLVNGATRAGGDITLEGSGGGVWCESTNASVSNCVLVGNISFGNGGGAYGGTIIGCTLSNNSTALGYGGAAAYCTLNNCMISSNRVGGSYEGGGVAYSTLNNCTIRANVAGPGGGGAMTCTLNACILAGNTGAWGGGAIICTLNNCIVTGNSAISTSGSQYAAALGGGTWSGVANNCTIVSNTIIRPVGTHTEALGRGAYATALNNCIVYYNNGPSAAHNSDSGTANTCCTTPLPATGSGNFTAPPLFVAGTSRLQSSSPCINSGNNNFAPAGGDFDGNPRIAGATVDVGAFEFQSPGSVISYAWLQQYALPTTGSVDYADPDGDGMNNWQEWRCDTDPTNAASVLRVTLSSTSPSVPNISWPSSTARSYFVERATDLNAQPAFQILATNIAGLAGTTTYSDTNTTGSGPYFYRVAPQ